MGVAGMDVRVKSGGKVLGGVAGAVAVKVPNVKFKPLKDLIVVQRIEVKSKSGLVLHTMSEIPGLRPAKVIAIGPGRPSEWNAEIIPMPGLKVGDEVLIHGGAGTKWEEDGETFYYILPADLVGVE